jgi:hypothetical protein
MGKKIFVAVVLALCFTHLPHAGAQERITLSTYYPAPYGEYESLLIEKNAPDLTLRRTDNAQHARILFRNSGGNYIANIYVTNTGNGDLVFGVGPNVADPMTLPPVLVIQNAGNVGIGTLAPAEKLHVNGNIRHTGTCATSDMRWKKDIKNIEDPLAKVLSLRGVIYKWDIENYPEMGFDDGVKIGLIAQDVEVVFPELIRTDYEGYKALEYERIVAVLIEAIKEQQSQINEQQIKITAIEEELKHRKKIN